MSDLRARAEWPSRKPRQLRRRVPPSPNWQPTPSRLKRPADEARDGFHPDLLDSTVIALPLLDKFKKEGIDQPYKIIIDVNRDYPGGRDKASSGSGI